MRVITLASTKGGTGKTTLSAVLAARAAQESKRVALIDTDVTQESLARWWELRGHPKNPKLIGSEASIEALELLMAEGWHWVFIDTPPGDIDRIEHAVFSASFVLIPTTPSPVDLEAVFAVTDLCEDREKPHAFLLNRVEPNWTKLANSADAYLQEASRDDDGRQSPWLAWPLAATGKSLRVMTRKSYVAAMTAGKTGPEIDAQAANETEALWGWLNATLKAYEKVR